MIPSFRLEEHHEAFLVWRHAIGRGTLAPAGNTLLHIDEHSDWSTPRLTRPLESLGEELSDVADFTYSELDVGNFIWPAVYLGIFGEVFWLRWRHTLDLTRRRMFIRATNAQRTEFVTGIDNGMDERAVVHAAISPDMTFEPAGPFVLDIDLDYFSSYRFPDYSGKRLEVTQAAFEEFRDNPYHFLRLAPGSKITPREESGRYYFYFGRPTADGGGAPGRDDILRRMDSFMHFLERSPAAPALILSARSVHSGYTPIEHVQFIEDTLWERLGRLYRLDFSDICHLVGDHAKCSHPGR